MQRVKKKSPLTLIEVVIALGLMAIVFSTLFPFLIQTIRLSKSLETLKSNALSTSYFYSRLLPIFCKADPSSFQLEKDESDAIYKVTFTFENGLDPALIFSGKVSASIFTDQNNNLLLSLDSNDEKMVQQEVLLSNITELSWEPSLPYFITLKIKREKLPPREFVFFFSDRPPDKGAYTIEQS